MQPVSQPSVDIEPHGVVRERADRRLLKRDRVLLELDEESLGQQRGVDKMRASAGVLLEHRGVNNVLLEEAELLALLNLERHAASSDAISLISNRCNAVSPDRDAQLPHPDPQAAAEFDLSTLGANGFPLKIDQDQPGTRTIRNTDGDGFIRAC